MSTASNGRRINVFVHLAYGFGANTWPQRYRAGQIIGVNEECAYGYERAQALGCNVTYSHDHRENMLWRYTRYAIRLSLGFDLLHALRNRKSIRKSDVVWTHTESQHLSVLCLTQWQRNAPKIIAQNVWLIDRWKRLPRWRRLIYKALMRRADVLTFHSPQNLAIAKALFPANHCVLVRFGIRNDQMVNRMPRRSDVVNLLAVGNDEDRDWRALIAAVGGWARCRTKIVSTKCKLRAQERYDNVQVRRVSNNEELLALYDWADVALVIVRQNHHASGLTAIQEAISRGVPVIASKEGGLELYFSGGEILFVENNSVDEIRNAIAIIATDVERQKSMTSSARELMRASLNSDQFVKAHVVLSEEALGFKASTGVAKSLIDADHPARRRAAYRSDPGDTQSISRRSEMSDASP